MQKLSNILHLTKPLLEKHNPLMDKKYSSKYSAEGYYSLKIRREGREISADAFLLGGCALQRARIRKDTVDTPSAKTLGKQQPEGPRSFLHFKLAPLLFVKCRDSGSACISCADELNLERMSKIPTFKASLKYIFKIIVNCRIVKLQWSLRMDWISRAVVNSFRILSSFWIDCCFLERWELHELYNINIR